MFDDSPARSHSAAPSGVDAAYDAIHATIVASERGRWFLEEYARRHRGADTNLVLTSLDRIEQLIRGAIEADAGGPATPDNAAGDAPEDLAAMLDMLRQARSDIVTHHGDPAASGEAAIADFRNAAEQVQELVGGSDLGAQLSFPVSRLTSAGDRLERSIGALRMLLELLDTVEQHLRQRTGAPGPSAPIPVEPVQPMPPPYEAKRPQSAISSTATVTEPAPVREPPPESVPLSDDMLVGAPVGGPQASAVATVDVSWDLTVASPDAAAETEPPPGPESVSEASLTDWAFAADEVEPQPVAPPRQALPEPEIAPASSLSERPSPPEPPEPPMSALERLEVREYSRQRVATAAAPPTPEAFVPAAPVPQASVPETSAPETDALDFLSVEPVAPPPVQHTGGGGGLDDLLAGDGDAPPDDQLASFEAAPSDLPTSNESPLQTGWADEPPPPQPTAESIFDTDLFETEDAHETSAPIETQASAPMNAGLLADDDDTSLHHDVAQPETEPSAFLDQLADMPEHPTAATGASEPAHGFLPTESEQQPDQPAWSDTMPDATSGTTPDAVAGEAETPPSYDADTDTPAVLERLENMRRAIAALMNEVNEKTPRRGQPPSAS